MITINEFVAATDTKKHQQQVIDRLSRKIQKLKQGTLSVSEITLLLFCIELIFKECGINKDLEKIYYKLSKYREGVINEQKDF